jgi:Copper transport outer membrane protein, MctB
MINFRFHLASLIAIFLALALGVVVGAGVIDRGVVDTLNNRLDKVERESDKIRGENNDLRDENSSLADFIGKSQCYAVESRLATDDVAVVAVRGIDSDSVKRTTDAVKCAGGRVNGVLWLEDKWNLANDADIKAMADALGSTARRPATLRAAAWKQLATRLRGAPFVTDGSTDLLARLQDAGFVTFDNAGDDTLRLDEFPSRGAATLLAVGSNAGVPDSDTVLPAATAIAGESVPLVVGDVYASTPDGPDRGSALKAIHDNPTLSAKVSTVDDLDRPQGPTTAVIALSDLMRIPATVGQYGLTSGQSLPDITSK